MRLAPLLCLTVLACTPQSGADTDSTAAPAASTAGTDAPAPTTGADASSGDPSTSAASTCGDGVRDPGDRDASAKR